jgi:hypothetical protein
LRDARRSPARKSSSQRPVCEAGRAKLRRKQRGAPPMAAISLTALARHFHPTESGGCLSRRKCVPSRNQSQVRMVSCPGFGRKSAASSPITTTSDFAIPRSRASGEPAIIFFRRESSDRGLRLIGFQSSGLCSVARTQYIPRYSVGLLRRLGTDLQIGALVSRYPVPSDRGQVCTA